MRAYLILPLKISDIMFNYQQVRLAFKSLSKFVKSKGFIIICIVLPVKTRVYEWVLHDKKPWISNKSQSVFSTCFQDLCKLNNINFVDLTPCLIDSSKVLYEKKRAKLYWFDDFYIGMI